jgi:hypothetical protein
VLDDPLPWRKMRQVYALLGLVKKWGAERVETACARAAEAEAFDVGLIERMIERATEGQGPATLPIKPGGSARFARPAEHFATLKRPGSGTIPGPERPSGANLEGAFDDKSRPKGKEGAA